MNLIEAKIIDEALWIRAADHHTSLSNALQRERLDCIDLQYELARSPAEFATMAEYKAYRLGVTLYSNAIVARGLN
jgi:hypothetical protein